MTSIIKNISLFCLLYAVCICVQAQTQTQDVIHLKDGSSIRGQIKEQVIGEHVKIELLGGSILVFEESEIELITKEQVEAPEVAPAFPEKTKRFSDYPITVRAPKTIYNMFAYGLAFGQGFNGNMGLNPTFTYKLGMHFNQYINIGLGIGLDPYEVGAISPVFVNFSGDIGKPARVMPHYFLDAGYGMSLGGGWNTQELRGGAMVHVGGGWKFNSRRRSEWMLTLGYKLQDTYQERQVWIPRPGQVGPNEPVTVTGTRLYQKIVMQVAIGF